MNAVSLYYTIKPLIPRPVQIWVRRKAARIKRQSVKDVWPVLHKAAAKPANWPGWPGQKKFALILTHDVDTKKGHDRCCDLLALEKEAGVASSFNFVPERYDVSAHLRENLVSEGYEVGVHGLNHDGKLFRSRQIFTERARKINRYIEAWGACGFRAPAMHHQLEWMHALNIEYDLSTFDTDPFEPQPDGVETIFPFIVNGDFRHDSHYLELPYTLPQDFTMFILLGEKDTDIWKRKLNWIAERGGMALLNTHPDYMHFGAGKPSVEEYPAEYYRDFLAYIKKTFGDEYWHPLPCECTRWFLDHHRNKKTINGYNGSLHEAGLPKNNSHGRKNGSNE